MDPKRDIIFTPHGIKNAEGEILDIEFEPDWSEEEIEEAS